MFKILKANKDAYITNRIIDSVPMTGSNVGLAGTLNLFKLYGASMSGTTPNLELSRILVHFDLSSIQNAYNLNKLDPTHNSFWAKLKLFDVYGGEPTPDQFTVSVAPLGISFDEGHGKDIVYYGDKDVCNYVSASRISPWVSVGCRASGSIGSGTVDYYTGSYESTQFFETGEENLEVDVTNAVRGMLQGTIPDCGWRISFTDTIESDDYTYFIKRFASRQAYDNSKHPKLVIGFDDSMQDTSQGMTLDSTSTIFLFNYDRGTLANLVSGSTILTGSNSVKLRMKLPISGGHSEYVFSAGQHLIGNLPVTGIYSSSFKLSSSDAAIANELLSSGSSLKFIPVWCSIDDSVTFLTGSVITVLPPSRGSTSLSPKKFVVTVSGLQAVHRTTELITLRVNVFDHTSPLVVMSRLPANSPGALQGVVTDAFYSVRNAVTQEIVIPFDVENGSTRLSSDNNSLFFQLDASNLDKNQSYVIDILLSVADQQQIYTGASGIFKVSDLQ